MSADLGPAASGATQAVLCAAGAPAHLHPLHRCDPAGPAGVLGLAGVAAAASPPRPRQGDLLYLRV